MKKRKNSKQFNRQFRQQFFTAKSGIILVLTLVIVLLLGFGGYRQKRQADQYRETISELSSEVKEIRETNEDLEAERVNTNTDEFKERIAREKLGLIREDEYALQESEEEDTSDGKKSGGSKDKK